MTQPLGVSNVRSGLTQNSSCTQFMHTAPRLTATIISSFGFKQSSLTCRGRKPNSRWWPGWEGKRVYDHAERLRGFKGPVGGAPSIGQDQFEEEVLKSDLPVLVDFWAEWCGPCKLVAPVVNWAAKNYAGRLKVYKIETDANPELVDKFKPYGLPTLILFMDGQEVPGSRKEGAITTAKLQAHLDNLLPALSTT